jgi:hypothetical protein
MSKYRIISQDIPEISGSKIIKDTKMGGIKLVYEVIDGDKKQQVIFIKPYKKNYASSKAMCDKGKWGNTSSPLANVWIKTHINYKNQNSIENIEFASSLIEVDDPILIGKLNKFEKIFTLGEESNLPKKSNLLTIITKIKNVLNFK